MSNTNINPANGPKDRQSDTDQSSEQVPQQRGVEDSAEPDDSLVNQMSHADNSVISPGEGETSGIVGYVDEHGLEDRADEGVRGVETE